MSGPVSWPNPKCEPVGYVSYSEWSRLRSCSLKAAFARDLGTKHWNRGSIWSALGNARHHLVEETDALKKKGLDKPTSDWVRARFDVLLTWERDRLSMQWSPAEVPSIRQWPDVVYVRTRLARDLGGGGGAGWPEASEPAASYSPPGEPAALHAGSLQRPAVGEHLVEAWVQDDERRLRGRVDRLENRDGHLFVVDLKSGVGASANDLVARHRDQMLFYAGLIEGVFGEWPGLELIPAADPPLAVPYRAAEVLRQRSEVRDDRTAFNATMDSEGLVAAAQPGSSTCAWCPFQVVCPALIHHWDEVAAGLEGPGSRAVAVAAGTVQSVRRITSATDVVIDQETDFSVPAGKVSITRLPAGLDVQEGDSLVVTGAEVAGGSQVLRARWDSRVRVDRSVTMGRDLP